MGQALNLLLADSTLNYCYYACSYTIALLEMKFLRLLNAHICLFCGVARCYVSKFENLFFVFFLRQISFVLWTTSKCELTCCMEQMRFLEVL